MTQLRGTGTNALSVPVDYAGAGQADLAAARQLDPNAPRIQGFRRSGLRRRRSQAPSAAAASRRTAAAVDVTLTAGDPAALDDAVPADAVSGARDTDAGLAATNR
jgi:hypothetical protein